MEKIKDRLLNVEQVRERLNCSRRHVYNLVETGTLRALRIGERNGIRIRLSILEQFLEQCELEVDL